MSLPYFGSIASGDAISIVIPGFEKNKSSVFFLIKYPFKASTIASQSSLYIPIYNIKNIISTWVHCILLEDESRTKSINLTELEQSLSCLLTSRLTQSV